MKLPIRDMISQPDTQAEPADRPALALPRRKHTDYPPPKVLRWEPSDWINPPSQERLRAGR
jgi:hypothetical protein